MTQPEVIDKISWNLAIMLKSNKILKLNGVCLCVCVWCFCHVLWHSLSCWYLIIKWREGSTSILLHIKVRLRTLNVPHLHLMCQEYPSNLERVPYVCQIYIFSFLRYRGVLWIKLYVFCKINLLVHSELLMDIIFGVRNILHVSGRLYQEHS